MPHGVRLSDEQIAEIRRFAGAGMSRNEIVRRLGVSPGSVSKYAPAGSFDRSETAAATKAHHTDMAARRAVLAQNLLRDAEKLRAMLWQPALVYNFGGKDNTYEEHLLEEQPVDAKRAIMATVATAMTTHLRLVDHDSDGGLEEARSVLDGFMDAVARRAHELGAAGDA